MRTRTIIAAELEIDDVLIVDNGQGRTWYTVENITEMPSGAIVVTAHFDAPEHSGRSYRRTFNYRPGTEIEVQT